MKEALTHAGPQPAVPDQVVVDVQPGTRVLITSDLHLAATPTDASLWAESEICGALEAIEGPAVLVMAGDLIELWAGVEPKVAEALAAHPGFATAVMSFGRQPGRRVIYLPGNHDGRLGWDEQEAGLVRRDLGAELAFAVDLVLSGPRGQRDSAPHRVRIEHGHRWDPANRFQDPRDPLDTPLGQHIVQEVLPDLAKGTDSKVLDGVQSLEDPRTFPSFVTSRIFYRRMLKETRWLLVPLLFAVGIHFGITLIDTPASLHLRARDFVIIDASVVTLALVTALVLVFAGRSAWRGASLSLAEKRGRGQNDNARAAARELMASGSEYVGLVSGHTHHSELTDLGNGFYANTGSGTKVVERVEARFDLPHVFVAQLQLSWVELDATDAGWTVRLVGGRRPLGGTRIENLVARRQKRVPTDPRVVSSLAANGPSTPE